MTNDELYTDYALQIFSSFVSGDYEATRLLFDSFKKEGKDNDPVFLPGLVFGLMYHMKIIFTSIANDLDREVEEIFSVYAQTYAMNREDLTSLPFLNVSTAEKQIKELLINERFLESLREELSQDDEDFLF